MCVIDTLIAIWTKNKYFITACKTHLFYHTQPQLDYNQSTYSSWDKPKTLDQLHNQHSPSTDEQLGDTHKTTWPTYNQPAFLPLRRGKNHQTRWTAYIQIRVGCRASWLAQRARSRLLSPLLRPDSFLEQEEREKASVKSSVRKSVVYSKVLFSHLAGSVTRPAKTGTFAMAQPLPRVVRRSDSWQRLVTKK